MDELIPELAAETEVVREAYAALNRNDIPAMVKDFDPQIEWIFPVEIAGGGTFRGLAAVTVHSSQARDRWAEGSCEPERFLIAGDKIIVFVHVHVRLKDETEWREGSVTDVFTFRDGRAVEVRTFTDRQQALEWAGAKASDAS